MSTHKDEKNGTWYVMVRYHDWKGVKRQKCKRGFATRREEQEWERNFQLQTDADPDMTFEAFMELYENDMRPRLKENTWLSKKHMIRTKLFPTFGKKMLADLSQEYSYPAGGDPEPRGPALRTEEQSRIQGGVHREQGSGENAVLDEGGIPAVRGGRHG